MRVPLRTKTFVPPTRSKSGESYGKNNRYTKMKCQLFFVAAMVIFGYLTSIASAQWAQTMGWGGAGAGTGKRAVLNSHCAEQTFKIQRLINLLAEVEAKRLLECGGEALYTGNPYDSS